MAQKIKFFFVILNFFILVRSSHATAVCVGQECSFISDQSLLLANLVDPVLGQIYTKDFLNAMAESAVLQNINSAMMGGTFIEKNRMSMGYSVSRSKIKPREFYFESTELRELPKESLAASPSLSYATNLGHILDKTGNWRKWNVFIQFFPFYLSENNIPFLKIRNTDVGGRVANGSFNVRYFPFADSSPNETLIKHGFSIGFGMYYTNQNILLNSYDRRPTQFQVDGDRRKWIGINDLKYDSKIYSLTTDLRYMFTISNFGIFGGLGGMYNHGETLINVERVALISSYLNRDDFLTTPSGVHIELSSRIKIREANYFGILGLSYKWRDYGVSVEYLRNQNTESLNLGLHYYF
ncbi:MAG: hypothetical protein SH817_07170 [Leptospira sp.]|nr:hypothetical protein [Leptospira sp.]